jgi:hypothetical protein
MLFVDPSYFPFSALNFRLDSFQRDPPFGNRTNNINQKNENVFSVVIEREKQCQIN